MRTAQGRQCPHVLEPEIGRELVDSPRLGSVRRSREPHSPISSIRLDSLMAATAAMSTCSTVGGFEGAHRMLGQAGRSWLLRAAEL
jgi:hypothetical protein